VPVFFQHQINANTRLGVWKIEEGEDFFKGNVPLHRDVTHPFKRLQHLAGRFLLQYLFPDFPYDLIRIADTRKPFLPNEAYHFSISHCGDYAAAIVSRENRVGVDIEMPVEKILRIRHKFVSEAEDSILDPEQSFPVINAEDFPVVSTTILWSVKEAVFKWYGDGGVDFREDSRVLRFHPLQEKVSLYFSKKDAELDISYRLFPGLVLTWVVT